LIKYGQKKKILKDYLIFFSISIFSKNLWKFHHFWKQYN
jgi:hypothetical protein